MSWTHLFTSQHERHSKKSQTSLTPVLSFATCSLSTPLFLRLSLTRQPSTLPPFQLQLPLTNTNKMPPKGTVSHLLHFFMSTLCPPLHILPSTRLGSKRSRASGTARSRRIDTSLTVLFAFRRCLPSTSNSASSRTGSQQELASRVHNLPLHLPPEHAAPVKAKSRIGHKISLWSGMSLTFLSAFRLYSLATPSPLSSRPGSTQARTSGTRVLSGPRRACLFFLPSDAIYPLRLPLPLSPCLGSTQLAHRAHSFSLVLRGLVYPLCLSTLSTHYTFRSP